MGDDNDNHDGNSDFWKENLFGLPTLFAENVLISIHNKYGELAIAYNENHLWIINQCVRL